MSTDTELKRKLGSMLGAGMLATALSAVPANFDPANLSISGSYAFAESGNSGSGEGGDNDSDSDNDSSEGGESGDNSGPGSGGESSESGESGESNESGESGENSGPGNSRSKNTGKKSSGGFFRNLFFGKNNGTRERNRHPTSGSIPTRFGRVVRSKTTRRGAEVRYSDGWSEKIRDGRYQLVNPKGRVVVSRRARNSDRNRLRTAAKK